MGKGKKGGKKRGQDADEDDWENDLEEIAKESGIDLHQKDQLEEIEQPSIRKKEKKKGKKKDIDSRQELEDLETATEKAKPNKSLFQALEIEGDDNDESGNSATEDNAESQEKVPETAKKVRSNQKDKSKKITENLGTDADDIVPVVQKSKKEKSKKKGKKTQEDDEDLNAILAELEISSKKEPESKKSKKKGKHKQTEDEIDETVKIEDVDDGMSGDQQGTEKKDDVADSKLDDEFEETVKVKKGKNQEKISEKTELNDDISEEGSTVKTAAQKKAEKKEREKKKKEAQKSKKAKVPVKSEGDAQEGTETLRKEKPEDEGRIKDSDSAKTDESVDVVGKKAVEDEAKGEESGDDEEEEGKDKKKKKKKKKKGEEEEKKKGAKRPGKALVKQMQEALEKAKAEEERLRAEEEAKLRAIEEAERKRQEKIQLEKERKEKRKQKEKERKEARRKEGTLLTAAQKEQKRRAEMMLEAMKQQGILIPSKDAGEQRKKVQYGKKKKKQDQVPNQTNVPSEAAEIPGDQGITVREEPMEEVKEVKEEQDKEQDNLPNSWEEEADGDDVKDNWEESEDESLAETEDKQDVAVKEVEKPGKTPTVPEKTEEGEESEESSDEDESEQDSEDESDEDDEESSTDEESESESEDEKLTPERIKEKARERIQKRREDAEARRSTDKLRSPVICVLGHVDTGKTKILDKIRHTHVQDGEAGGITQQIGATMVPLDAIKEQTKMVKEFQKFDLQLPGLLIIDTPGHESFSNLRSRGSSLCDMAILVVDIMHGLEPQTIESISLLRKKHTPFIVALNKIDRLFEWKRGPQSQVEDTIKKQKKNTKLEFEERTAHVIREFAEQGLNAALAFKNPDEKSYISLCPTSAHSGDGMGDLISLICKLTQTRLAKKLAYSEEIQSTVMEVKALPGLGTTIDAILVNGKLREGDTIVTGGIEGPIVTQIRALLTPQPLRELRVKSQYIQHKELEAAQGVKITAKDLDRAMAGAPLFVARQEDEIEVLKDEVEEIVSSSLKAIKVSERGVYVQASTLGSLEALLEFLKSSKIPYAGVNIGPVHKKDVMKASVMLEHEPMFAVILAFDVKVERDSQEFADKEGVKIFTADIIYHLFDKFTAYCEDYKQKKKDEFKHLAVFPCKLRIMPQHIFNSRGPIVVGVHIEAGTVRLGTPITVPSKEFCDVGFVTGIEANHKQMERASAGQEVCVKIECPQGEAPRMYGRHFTHEDLLMSKVTRESIDCLKEYFRDEMQKSDWQLVIEMKKVFGII